MGGAALVVEGQRGVPTAPAAWREYLEGEHSISLNCHSMRSPQRTVGKRVRRSSGLDTGTLLAPFGFSAAEEETYSALLRSPRTTGYKIAQHIKRPVSNTYKALELLLDKGAAMVEDGDPAIYTAVPVKEVVDEFQRRIRTQGQRAITGLGLFRPDSDERVYRLANRGQTLMRARALIGKAKEVLLVNAFPTVIRELQTELQRAVRRGVLIAAKLYAPTNLKGAWVSLDPEAAIVTERWPADWLILVADGQQMLLALVDRSGDKVYQSIWSKSPMLSFATFSSQYAEILLAEVQRKIEEGASNSEVKETLREYSKLAKRARVTEGYRRLAARLTPKRFS